MAPIFSDEIFTATDLNRHAGQVLDQAKHHPVTITRNDETFALLSRKDASRMTREASNAKLMASLATAISLYGMAAQMVPAEHPFEWVNAFGREELRELLVDVHGAFRGAVEGEGAWDNFEAVLHEWHESAIALRSDALIDAFAAPSGEEVPLTPPAVPVECGTDA